MTAHPHGPLRFFPLQFAFRLLAESLWLREAHYESARLTPRDPSVSGYRSLDSQTQPPAGVAVEPLATFQPHLVFSPAELPVARDSPTC